MTQSRKSIVNTRKLTLAAMFVALAYVSVVLFRLKIMPTADFLTYDVKDVVITLGGLILGPLYALLIAVITAFLEMISISDTGPIGFIMNALSSSVFACTAAIIYTRRKTLNNALIGLICGVIIMVITMLPLEAMAATSTSTDSILVDTWDGKAATSFASGDGSKANPYVIVTAEQMAYFAQAVNAGNFGSKHVILANNIDLSGYSWTSIGSSSSCYFTGTFDGKGYTVSGLEITTTNGVAGLFGYTSGTIRNFATLILLQISQRTDL